MMKQLFSIGIGFLAILSVDISLAYQAPMTPETALERLMEGNDRFVNDKSLCPARTQARRLASSLKQKPFAIILGCSDSRVPPELAFDQGIGDLFVVRVAGNVVGDTEIDSVTYSALYNGSSIVVVLGHESCGAVSAVLENKAHDIPSVETFIRPAIDDSHDLNNAIKANIQHSVNEIKTAPAIASLVKAGKLKVVGAYYQLKTGKITFLE